MKDMETKRLKNVLITIDNILTDSCYYDDDKQEEVYTINQKDVYKIIMETEDYRFLGAEKIKQLIKTAFEDWAFFRHLLITLNAI